MIHIAFMALLLANSLAKVPVVVDPRVELLTTVFRLAGSEEFNEPLSASPYSKLVDTEFAPFKDLPAVLDAKNLREKYHVAYDAVAQLAISLTDIHSFHEKVPFDLPPKRWDMRLHLPETRQLLADLKLFVKDAHYDAFLKKEQPYFDRATTSLESLITKYKVADTMNAFFGMKPNYPPKVIIGLLCGGGNYGMSVEYPNGSLEASPIIGAYHFEADGTPTFGDESLSVVMHEFSHPFINPAVTPYLPELKPYVERLLPKLANSYRYQGYSGSDSIIYETMVRAVENHLVRKLLDPETTRLATIWQRCAGFLVTSDLADYLDVYEANRKKYPHITDFVPELVKKYEDLVSDPNQIYGRCPQVTDFHLDWGAIKNGQQAVIINVKFDRPMLTKRFGAWIEGGDSVQTGPPTFDSTAEVLTEPFTVELGKASEFVINPEGWGYVSQSGYPVITCRFPVIPPGPKP